MIICGGLQFGRRAVNPVTATPSLQPLNANDLQQAFLVFDDASRQLADSYSDLQDEVSRLSAEVAVANGRLREQLRQKDALAERLSSLLAALPVGVLVLDAGGLVTEGNAAAATFLGVPLAGRAWPAIARERLRPADAANEWQSIDGKRRFALSACDSGDGGGRLVVMTEITRQHAMAVALARGQRLASMGAMSASLAHQLRTPLAAALLYASQLKQPVVAPAEQARFAGELVNRLLELEKFIQCTLSFVSGRVEMQEGVDVAPVLEDAQRLAAPQMHRAGVLLDVDVVHGLSMRANREALLSMLLNLLDNAQQACAGGGRVQLTLRRSGDDAVLCVADDGCGMTAEVSARLFEPYFTTRSDGHGLGLAFVRSVVEAHGGHVSVNTAPGQGTQFRVSLPIAGKFNQE